MEKLITSRDPQGLHAISLFEAIYNKSALTKEQAQILNERGREFQAGIKKLIEKLVISNQFADEEVPSSYTYPQEYEAQDVKVQLEILCKYFPQLSPDATLQLIANGLPQLPEYAEAWIVIPKWEKLTATYPEAVQQVLDVIDSTRNFYNCRNGEIDTQHLRVHARTEKCLDEIAATQPGDFLILAAQYGIKHKGKSVRRARETFIDREFGLGAFAVGCMALTHPKRYVRWEELDTDCPGDEFKSGDEDFFSLAPFFNFRGGKLLFATNDVSSAHNDYGSVSAFLPQQ